MGFLRYSQVLQPHWRQSLQLQGLLAPALAPEGVAGFLSARLEGLGGRGKGLLVFRGRGAAGAPRAAFLK